MNLEQLIRRTTRCGMTDGTVLTIEFISGFEKFNTRPYHNYETWAQGWRVSGLGVTLEREDLEHAVSEWAALVTKKRAGEEIPPHARTENWKQKGEPFRAPVPLDDWIQPQASGR